MCTTWDDAHQEGVSQRVEIKPNYNYCLSIDVASTTFSNYNNNGNLTLHSQINTSLTPDCEGNTAPSCEPSGTCFQFSIPENGVHPNFSTYTWDIPQGTSGDDIYFWVKSDNLIGNFLAADGVFIDNIKLTCETNELVNISWNELGTNPPNCLIQFTSTLIDPNLEGIEYLWDFGDGSSLSDEINNPNPTHVYNTAGVYDVTLTITNRDGCCQTKELTVTCGIPTDYCKYICHEEYLASDFTCAVGVLYNDHNPNTPALQTLTFSQPYEHTDFVGIANEIETEFQVFGINMMVNNYDPTGNVTCYKSICVGCDGNGIPPQFELDPNGMPTGVVSGTWVDSTSIWTGNGILVGDYIVNALGDTIWGTYKPAIITFNIANNIDPNTVVVTPSPNGLGFIIQYEETEGLFAMGDVEILRVLGNNEFDGVSCDNASLVDDIVSVPFNQCP